MKNLLLYASVVAAMMLAGACQKEVLNPVSEGDAAVSFSLELPAVETKAMSKAESTNIVYYEIWNSDWSRQLYPVDNSALASATVSGCKATIKLTLVSDQTYNFIFWAQNDSHDAYDVNELKNVKVDYTKIDGNQDKFDAFYAVKTIKVEGPVNETVYLYRPFAQLNFGADIMQTTFGPVVVDDTEITVSNLATVFNTIKGVGETPTNAKVTFKANGCATTTEDLVTHGQSYTWVTMDYMLMMDEKSIVDVDASFEVQNMDAPVTHSLTNVPLKKNYRTNIVGNLFTTDAVLNILVDPVFNQPDEILRVVGDSDALALAIAQAKDGDTIYISDEVTMPYFTDKALNFVGVTDDAAVKQSPASHIDAFYAGAELNFSNLTIVGTSYTSNTQGYQKAAKETYSECHFVNYHMFAGEETVVNDCTFENEGQYFWTATAKNITFNDCVFNGTERAVKVCTVGNAGARVVTFNDCQFTAATQVKAAIEIDGTKGSSYTVNINNCTATGFAEGEFTGEPLFNVEGADKVVVYVDGNKWLGNGLYGGPAGEIIVSDIAELQAVLDAADSDVHVLFAADMTGNATVNQKEGVNVVIDGNTRKFDGTVYVNGHSRYNGAETLTIKNVNFESDTVADFISSNSSTDGTIRYAHNVTVEGCSFVGGYADAVAIRTRQAYNISVKNCTADLGHSFAQLTSTAGFSVETVTVDAPRGFNLGNSNSEASFTDCKINATKADGYGIRYDNGKVLNVTGCEISAYEPVVFRNCNAACQFNLASSTLTPAGPYHVVVASGSAPVMNGVDGLSIKY